MKLSEHMNSNLFCTQKMVDFYAWRPPFKWTFMSTNCTYTADLINITRFPAILGKYFPIQMHEMFISQKSRELQDFLQGLNVRIWCIEIYLVIAWPSVRGSFFLASFFMAISVMDLIATASSSIWRVSSCRLFASIRGRPDGRSSGKFGYNPDMLLGHRGIY